MIEWCENYELGIEKVDRQHKCLVDHINNLIQIQERNKDRASVETVFLGLISYCDYHFENEEMVMQESEYHDFDHHRSEHDIFFNIIERAKLDYLKGDISSLSFIIDYLKIWIIDHILIQDKKYAMQLKEKF